MIPSRSLHPFPSHQAKPGSLSYALLGAAHLLQGVAQGQSLQASLPALTSAWQLSATDRGAIQAITFHTLRHWAQARALREILLPKPKPAWLGNLIEAAIAIATPEDAPLYPEHTLVSQAVEAAKACEELQAAQGVVNAVLRRWQRERAALNAEVARLIEVKFNHPQWWVDKLKTAYPHQYQAICEQNLSQASMTLRVYTRKIKRDAYLAELEHAGIAAYPLGQDAIVLHQALPVEKLPRFDEGLCSVQDLGAQLAAQWLDAQPGHRVLDACAAPGGKTAHLLERADVDMLALDSDAKRLERVAQTLTRIGLKAELKHADAAKPATWWDGKPFDRILLDAPCSASGIVRRHPDILWLRRKTDIAALAKTQSQLLKALWPLLKPGGRLLYCTCSVFPEEGEQQTTAFLANTPDARPIPLDLDASGLNLSHNLVKENSSVLTSTLSLATGVQLLPYGPIVPTGTKKATRAGEAQQTHETTISHDGFYYALLEKTEPR